MALSIPKAPGVAQMMKDGARVSKINCYLLKILEKGVYLIEFLSLENWFVVCMCVLAKDTMYGMQ